MTEKDARILTGQGSEKQKVVYKICQNYSLGSVGNKDFIQSETSQYKQFPALFLY